MGGLLALRLLREHFSAPWASGVLLAPALTLGGPTEAAVAVINRLGWPRRIGKDPPQLAKQLLPPAYWQIPVAPTVSLIELLSEERVHRCAPDLPMLVMHGSSDRTIPMRRARRIVRDILPAARHVVVPGAGHLLMRTRQAETVMQEVIDFMVSADALAARDDRDD